MKKFPLLFLAACLLAVFTSSVNAQGVAINTDGSAANNSAMLDVSSTSKGFLPPRMTTAQIEAIASPADGLQVYNTTEGKLYIFVSASGVWKELNYGAGVLNKSCGILTDTRDGKTYNTVIIGSQCWMKENLNIGVRIDGSGNQTNNSYIEKYCYNNDEANCTTYGGLYQWDEMMEYSSTEGVQGICPTGWHLPNDAEWTNLTTFLGGESVAGGKMKEPGTTHWETPNTGATNTSGFSGLPGGKRLTSGNFNDMGIKSFFWSSSESSTPNAWYRSLFYNYAGLERYHYIIAYGFSVRCVKD